MNLNPFDFVHPFHLQIFTSVARSNRCHILVRKTGRATIGWIGRPGYTGKRGDLKAKTADRDVGPYRLAGLVVSPFLHFGAFSKERWEKGPQKKSPTDLWLESAHLITVPRDRIGFDDAVAPQRCRTPYLVQTNPRHRHFGCVALVEMGLLIPRYVHGDYDLYAIIPAGRPFKPENMKTHESEMGASMTPGSMPLHEQLQLRGTNIESLLAFRVATTINTRILGTSPDLLGSLMVNHGEDIYKPKEKEAKGQTDGRKQKDGNDQEFEPVLAILAEPRDGKFELILKTKKECDEFYASA